MVRIGIAMFLTGGIYLHAGESIAPPAMECAATGEGPALRSERLVLASGAELVTYFEPLPPDSNDNRPEMPLFAVLKDTLDDSDPRTDRIRQVWAFTYSRPSLLQRMAGGIPFLYHGAGLDTGPGTRPPAATVDLGNPSRGMRTGLSFAALRSRVLNPIGALARLTSDSFFGNYGEYRQPHVWEAAAAISSLPTGVMNPHLTNQEAEAVETRLTLTNQPLGGLVAGEYLSRAHVKQRVRLAETRGHNWELLRQRAEEGGLYLKSQQVAGLSASFGILWVAQPDLDKAPVQGFKSQFLNIANPFNDDRVRHWEGYREEWTLDGNGVPVDPDAPGATRVPMIPLAVYALDHPRVPLLLVDFRRSGRPQRREMGLKFTEDLASGVLGLTTFGNLTYTAAKSSWMFVHTRHGGATNRAARRRARVEVRHAVATDFSLDPGLRREILSRLERMNVNPLERSWDREVRDAWTQYETLHAYALETQLSRELDADRKSELRAYAHGPGTRALFRLAEMGTLGLYRHREAAAGPAIIAKLGEERRASWAKRQPQDLPPFDEPVLAGGGSSPTATRMGR
jgi:hypothetical protein